MPKFDPSISRINKLLLDINNRCNAFRFSNFQAAPIYHAGYPDTKTKPFPKYNDDLFKGGPPRENVGPPSITRAWGAKSIWEMQYKLLACINLYWRTDLYPNGFSDTPSFYNDYTNAYWDETSMANKIGTTVPPKDAQGYFRKALFRRKCPRRINSLSDKYNVGNTATKCKKGNYAQVYDFGYYYLGVARCVSVTSSQTKWVIEPGSSADVLDSNNYFESNNWTPANLLLPGDYVGEWLLSDLEAIIPNLKATTESAFWIGRTYTGSSYTPANNYLGWPDLDSAVDAATSDLQQNINQWDGKYYPQTIGVGGGVIFSANALQRYDSEAKVYLDNFVCGLTSSVAKITGSACTFFSGTIKAYASTFKPSQFTDFKNYSSTVFPDTENQGDLIQVGTAEIEVDKNITAKIYEFDIDTDFIIPEIDGLLYELPFDNSTGDSFGQGKSRAVLYITWNFDSE